MGYELIEIDGPFNEHWILVNDHLVHKLEKKFEHPHVEKIWRDKIGHHDFLYWVHIKTGHFGNHHHWTVVFEVKNGHAHLIDVHEGHKSLF